MTLQEASEIRGQIADLPEVDLIIGPDMMTDAYLGNSFLTNDLVDEFYKDKNAVMEIIFRDGDSDRSTHKAIDKIYDIVGKDNGYFTGSAVSNKETQESITREIIIAIGMALIIIWAILTLTTNSWFEPFLFIFIMIVAILLNMGSNIIFGSISFFTFSTAAILQLAVSMDYSIFLLHTFTSFKNQGMEIHDAMEAALKEACNSILASGATTIVGFIVIALMQFKIGKDVGFVLTKGIIFSLLTVLLLMPTLILRFDDKIAKTAHKPFIPSFDGLARTMYKIRKPILIAALILAAPCYVGQGMNAFYYGNNALGAGEGSRLYNDQRTIDELFGKSNVVLAIVPNGSPIKERELSDALNDEEYINYAISLSGALPEGVPESFVPKKLAEQLRSERYARIIISMNNVEESSYSFDCSNRLTELVHQYYPENSYVIGMTPTTIDIRDIMTEDYNRVSIISLIGVAIVVMLTFQSFTIPILVIIPIEVAIYLNMTIPYVLGESMVYIGYIIVSCLQLGATIDYSILMTNNYMEMRETMDRKQAAIAAISKSTISILTSGMILTVVGYLLYFTSSVQAISQVGRLVGRGALLSMVLVMSLLPALLSAFDTMIRNQQKKAKIRREKQAEKRKKRLEKLRRYRKNGQNQGPTAAQG